MRLSDARALLPALVTEVSDPAADAARLNKLADWCQRYTPTVSVDGDDGLWLDITGAAHLHGGEVGLLEDLTRRLKALHLSHQLGLAETPGAAWAIARFSTSPSLSERSVAPRKSAQMLARLPLAALRLEDTPLYLLNRFGLKTIGDLLQLPRASLKRRFPSKEIAESVVQRLDQALGILAEPLVPLRPVPLYSEQISSPEPILETESFRRGLDQLLQRLCRRLEQDLKGATALTFTAYHGDGGTSHIAIATARASRDAGHLMGLFRDKIETINPGFGVDHLVLYVTRAENLDIDQLSLKSGTSEGGDEAHLDYLVDRLSSRLGAGAVQRCIAYESHIPERAETRVSALHARTLRAQPSGVDMSCHKSPRPMRLLAQPERVEVITEVPEGAPKRFTWRRVAHHVIRAEGPERIAPEWWRQTRATPHRTRDYYRVETDKGQCFWLFRAGLYDRDNHLPTWHMHGFFS